LDALSLLCIMQLTIKMWRH